MSRQERETSERVTPVSRAPETPSGTMSEVREREIYRSPVTWEEMRTIMREAPEREPVRTWKPTVGGNLAMIAGFWNIIVGAGIILGSLTLNVVSPSFMWSYGSYALTGTAAGIALCVLGVISAIGGYFATQRRLWTFALIGAIAALVPSPVILPFIMGIFSIFFVSSGKRDFEYKRD